MPREKLTMDKRSKLTATEDKVLQALYHASKRGESLSAAAIASEIGASEAEVLKALNRLCVLGMVGKPDRAEFALGTVDTALRDLDKTCECDTPSRVLMASILLEREWDRAKREWMYRNTPAGMERAAALLRGDV